MVPLHRDVLKKEKIMLHDNFNNIWLDWIPRNFRGLERVEISFLGLISSIELLEIFKIDLIFFDFFWIFSNKIVFELVFYFALFLVRISKDTLFIFWKVLAYCIFCTISPSLGELGKGRHLVIYRFYEGWKCVGWTKIK